MENIQPFYVKLAKNELRMYITPGPFGNVLVAMEFRHEPSEADITEAQAEFERIVRKALGDEWNILIHRIDKSPNPDTAYSDMVARNVSSN